MAKLTLGALAQRVAELERKMAEMSIVTPVPAKDWRRVVGMFDDDDFSRQVDAEALAIREADRRAARVDSTE